MSTIFLAAALAATISAFAQTNPPSGPPAAARVEKFSATTTSVPAENLTVRLSRWSTDADGDKLVAAFNEKGAEGLRAALAASQTLGYIWSSGPLGYSLRYARRIPQPDGGARIILATDRPVDLFGSPSKGAKAPDPSKAAEYPFTVIELRLNRRGQGEGRTSTIAADPAAKTIALESYEKATVILKGVKEENP